MTELYCTADIVFVIFYLNELKVCRIADLYILNNGMILFLKWFLVGKWHHEIVSTIFHSTNDAKK